MEEITGVVERITFHSPDTGYTVARVQTPRAKELTTVVGSFANVQAGQTLKLQGLWKEHPKYGSQFQVQQYHETKPATLTGIEKYLGSGLIKGVGPVTAKRIVAHFQLETLDIIEKESDRLLEVPGIGRKRVKMIQTAWAEQKAIKEVMLFLQGYRVSTTYIDHEEQEMVITYTDLPVVYDFADLNEIGLAWAITIHKSQGSEYPVVILPLYMQHYLLLSRNLLYTGLTRAKQLALIIGPEKAIGFTTNQKKEQLRYTRLRQRLS